MKKLTSILILSLLFTLSSCDGEKLVKGLFWGMNKLVGEGFIPSTEIMALGEFERSEIHISNQIVNGEKENLIELRLYNGRSEALIYNQENTARKVAELYLKDFSKVKNYDTIKIYFIQTDPLNPENVALNEYIFQIADFL